VLHRASAGEGVTLQRLNKMSAQQWQAWIRDHKDSIKLVDSDSDVLSYVASTPGAIGLVELHSVNDRVTVVRIDGKVPLEEGYLPH
jgi:ABC-type phosphate transport system substrate-binding protein